MAIYSLFGISGALFIVGLFLVIRGSQDSDDENTKDNIKAVPISNPSEIQELKRNDPKKLNLSDVFVKSPENEGYRADQKMTQAIQMSQEVKSFDAIKKPVEAEQLVKGEEVNQPEEVQEKKEVKEEQERNVQEVDRLNKKIVELSEVIERQNKEAEQKISELKQERVQIQQALEREVANKDTTALTEEDQKKLKDKEDRILQLEGSIARLTAENHRWQTQAQENQIKKEELEKKLSSVEVVEQISDDQEGIKLKALEDEILNFKEQSQKEVQKYKLIVSNLRNENDEYVKKSEQYDQDINELQVKLQNLEALAAQTETIDLTNAQGSGDAPEDSEVFKKLEDQNKDLKIKLEESNTKLTKIEEQFEYIKLSYEQKINEAQTEIYALKNSTSQQAISRNGEGVGVNRLAELELSVTDLTEERDELLQIKTNLSRDFQKIKELNEHLLEKEKILQYELSKTHAQSVGLEKICEDFKEQLDEKRQNIGL